MSDIFENPKYVYESPDGGDTVYQRLPGTSARDLYRENLANLDQIREDRMWGEIRRMAKTDPGMQELLQQVVVYYNLKREHKQ